MGVPLYPSWVLATTGGNPDILPGGNLLTNVKNATGQGYFNAAMGVIGPVHPTAAIYSFGWVRDTNTIVLPWIRGRRRGLVVTPTGNIG